MISRMLGAPFGGTTRGGHHWVESVAAGLITPPKGMLGGGICWPEIVVVALGAPKVPVTCCARVGARLAHDMSKAIDSFDARPIGDLDFRFMRFLPGACHAVRACR